MAIVAAGASIGKEGAPRELGALFGGSLSKGLHLFISDRQLLIACGAGAGLASVYQVPFASALFVLETLGVCWKLKNIIIILATTYVSAYCAKPIIGGHTLYIVDKVTIDSSSFIQAIILALFVTPQFLWETDRFWLNGFFLGTLQHIFLLFSSSNVY